MAESAAESIWRTLMFSPADYVVVALLLLLSAGVGIFYGFFRGKVTTEDYLMGGRNMKLIPTSLSLIATLVSGTTMLGNPADAYLNGCRYVYGLLGVTFAAYVISTAFLPVLHKLKVTSGYQYLEMRFCKSVRLLVSVIFVIQMIMSIPRFIYSPAVVFNQVTGQNLHYGSALITVVCIFYTCVGGFKAVVWTDVIQSTFMYMSLFIVIIKGTIDVGGPSVVIERSIAGGRLEAPNFNLDPTLRYGFWPLAFGGFCTCLHHNIFYQSALQRYLSLPKLKTAKKAVLINVLGGMVAFAFVCIYFGLVIYTAYYDCDPITTKVARGKDQIVPLFVMQTLGQYPGLPGLFVAGIFSASLSSLSSALNALSSVILEDLYKPLIKRPLTQTQSNILMKTVVVVFGLGGGALVLVMEKMGTIFQMTFTFGTMTDGPILGLYIMGFFLPFANTKGIFAGGITGLSFVLWLVLGSQAAYASGYLRHATKPLSVEGCSSSFHLPNATSPAIDNSDVFYMYRISHFWNTPMSCVLTLVVGMIVSYLTGGNENSVNREFLSPWVRRFVPEEKSSEEDVPINGYKAIDLHGIPDDKDLDERMEKLLPEDRKSP